MKPTLILRHRRENLKKCSLRTLTNRADLTFFSYPNEHLPDLSSYFLLKVGAPILSVADRDLGFLLLDGTWKLAEVMEKNLPLSLPARSLPSHFRTAYPRRQTHCSHPDLGLASIEALYLALVTLGRSTEGILDNYFWRKDFLEINKNYL